MEIIADLTETAIIHAKSEKIDLTAWLFTLKEHEYRACSTGHIAAGSTSSPDGIRMSINVEMIAGNLLIQHYVQEIGERNHCRVSSVSDSFSPLGESKLGVTWETKVQALTEETCEFSNRVIVSSTKHFEELLKSKGMTDLSFLITEMAANARSHNQEETPAFAKDIEQKANSNLW